MEPILYLRFWDCDDCGRPVEDRDEMLCSPCKARAVAAFIRRHGCPAYVVDGRVLAIVDCSGASGVAGAEVASIGPTFQAARAWLGY